MENLRTLPPRWRSLFRLAVILGLILAINHVFHFQAFVIVENRYLYLLLAIFLSFTFLLYPAHPRDADRIPWYDVAAFIATIACAAYLAYHAINIVAFAWEFNPPRAAVVVSLLLWALVLEGIRRTSGLALFVVLLVVSLYPLYAPYLPTFISGTGYSLVETASFHVLSTQSLLGLPLQVFATIVIGFILFGVVLQVTGTARFFTDAAMALMGHSRGGPAKMAAISSGLMGSMSGSVISNVLTTGSVTIPLMKRLGYPPRFAAAIEACASAGGVLMPPVMGATAFVMASFLSRPYADVMIAAALPSLLYYYSLVVQIDALSARLGLKGLPSHEIPSLWGTLKRGWPYLFALVLLVYLIVALKIEGQAPFWTSLVLLALSMLQPGDQRRPLLGLLTEFVDQTGRLLVELVGILAGVGFVLGSLSITGMAQAVARELIHLAGESGLLLLIMGAVTSFILGTGMTITACYVFLAVVLAPALVQVGFDPLAAHLFIFYWGMLSDITPPVALSVFAASALAGSDPMRTSVEAMRLGVMLYILPFLFVYSPLMILREGLNGPTLLVMVNAAVGIWLMAGGLQGYLPGIGRPGGGPLVEGLQRAVMTVGGFLLALPQGFGLIGQTLILPGANVAGLVLGLASAASYAVTQRRARERWEASA